MKAIKGSRIASNFLESESAIPQGNATINESSMPRKIREKLAAMSGSKTPDWNKCIIDKTTSLGKGKKNGLIKCP